MSLSPKERRFVSEYLKDQNATQAAKRAGYSAKTAKQQGSRLLSKVYLRDEIDTHLQSIQEKSELTAGLVRAKVLAMLTFDPRKAFNADGTMKDVSHMSDDIVVALSGIEVDDSIGEVKKIKFTDRLRAAELAAKILGMLSIDSMEDENGRARATLTATIDFSGLTRDELRTLARMRTGHGNGAQKV